MHRKYLKWNLCNLRTLKPFFWGQTNKYFERRTKNPRFYSERSKALCCHHFMINLQMNLLSHKCCLFYHYLLVSSFRSICVVRVQMHSEFFLPILQKKNTIVLLMEHTTILDCVWHTFTFIFHSFFLFWCTVSGNFILSFQLVWMEKNGTNWKCTTWTSEHCISHKLHFGNGTELYLLYYYIMFVVIKCMWRLWR